MNVSDKIHSTEESLSIITEMIMRTQQNMRGGSFHFIMWGWITVAGFAGHYILMRFTDFDYPYLIWLIAIPGWLMSFAYGRKKSHITRVVNYTDKLVMWTWVGFTISIVILIFSGIFYPWLNGLILLLAGMATFSTGLVIRFKPLIIGGSMFWIFAPLALAVPYMDSFLVSSLAIVCGYLIPGYMLKRSVN